MEGFLNLKALLSSPRVYVILDRQQVTCYSSLDGKNGLFYPKTVRLTFNLRNAKIMNDTKSFRYGITIISSQNNTTLAKFGCLNDEMHASWFKVLDRATRLHLHEEEQVQRRQSSFQILDLDPRQRLTHNYISRSYKKLCLVNHPDRGGDVNKFNQLYTAYETLRSIQDEQDRKNNTVKVDYEAIIEKGGNTIGFGLMVVEEKTLRTIVVQSVNKNILLHGLTAEAHGEIKEGDELIMIDQDDCSSWPMTRIRSRLANDRVHVGAKITFTLARRIPKESSKGSDNAADARDHGIATTTIISPVRTQSLISSTNPQGDLSLKEENIPSASPLDSPVNIKAARKFFQKSADESSEKVLESAWLGEDAPLQPSLPKETQVQEQDDDDGQVKDASNMDDGVDPVNDPFIDEDELDNFSDDHDEVRANHVNQVESNITGDHDIESEPHLAESEPINPTQDPIDSSTIEAELCTDERSASARMTIEVLESQILSLRQELLLKTSLCDSLQEQLSDLEDRVDQSDALLKETYSDVEEGISQQLMILREQLSAANKEKRSLSSAIYGQRYLAQRYYPAQKVNRTIDIIKQQYKDREERFLALERQLKALQT